MSTESTMQHVNDRLDAEHLGSDHRDPSTAHMADTITPVQPTLHLTAEHFRFADSITAPGRIKRVTIVVRGATAFHCTLPQSPTSGANVAWDVHLRIQPGISEATVISEDQAGVRTTVRRLLIARTSTPTTRPATTHILNRQTDHAG
jgi:hypothetical protein